MTRELVLAFFPAATSLQPRHAHFLFRYFHSSPRGVTSGRTFFFPLSDSSDPSARLPQGSENEPFQTSRIEGKRICSRWKIVFLTAKNSRVAFFPAGIVGEICHRLYGWKGVENLVRRFILELCNSLGSYKVFGIYDRNFGNVCEVVEYRELWTFLFKVSCN